MQGETKINKNREESKTNYKKAHSILMMNIFHPDTVKNTKNVKKDENVREKRYPRHILL